MICYHSISSSFETPRFALIKFRAMKFDRRLGISVAQTPVKVMYGNFNILLTLDLMKICRLYENGNKCNFGGIFITGCKLTSSATSDENFVKMTYLVQCIPYMIMLGFHLRTDLRLKK